jgi:hypothetical protein
MSIFNGLYKIGKGIVATTTPTVIAMCVPESIPATVGAAVVKHRRVLSKTDIGNNAIPYLNILISSAVSYYKHISINGDPVGSIIPAINDGVIMAGGSTILHQSIKIPLGRTITGPLAKKVGPGDKFSI